MKTKKVLVIVLCVMVAIAILPMTIADAASTPTTVDASAVITGATGTYFFANGTPVTVTDNSSTTPDTILISWDGGSKVADKTTTIFGGSLDADCETASITVNSGTLSGIVGGGFGATKYANVTTANVTINGGTFNQIFGGGYGLSKVTTANVTMNDGATNFLNGGGASYVVNKEFGTASNNNIVETVTITVNGGTVTKGTNDGELYVGGGSGSYTTVNKATLNMKAGNVRVINAGASAGLVKDSTLNISGGTMSVVQTARKGTTEKATINVTGGTIDRLSSGVDPQEEGASAKGIITASATSITGGTVKSLLTGNSNGTAISDINTVNHFVAYKESTVTADSTGSKAYKISIASDVTNGKVEIKTLTYNSDGELTVEILATPESGYQTAKYLANGEETTAKFVATADTEVSATFEKVATPETNTTEEASEVKNPQTVDNIIIYASVAIIAIAGLVIMTIKKRK